MKYNAAHLAGTPAMAAANFCVECGERIARKGWRARLRGQLCDTCAQRLGTFSSARPLLVVAIVALAAFAIGKYTRPSPPPLIIQRAANSSLSDVPVDPNQPLRLSKDANTSTRIANSSVSTADDVVYICVARTRKGTSCRQR